MRPLGKNQLGVLRALKGRALNSERERPYPGSGWTWSTPSETVAILESLARRGLVDVKGEHKGLMGDHRTWSINEAGREALNKERRG